MNPFLDLKIQLLALGLPSDAEIDIDETDSPETFDLMQTFMDKTSTQPRFATSFLYNVSEECGYFHFPLYDVWLRFN